MHPTWHFFGEDNVEADDEEEEDNDDSWDTIFSDKPILSSVKSGNLDLLDSQLTRQRFLEQVLLSSPTKTLHRQKLRELVPGSFA